ncbi:hypothetical protein CDAR_250921 [Caerostris darwini]|uniref:Uncharacterized protein n=1 Tax=Caerostris darwini TaxID=1538125 RepID=A0AAV4TNJ7_9ARAC|nr:hypothetical protein CDAR_250921 [Caerostris darwini]
MIRENFPFWGFSPEKVLLAELPHAMPDFFFLLVGVVRVMALFRAVFSLDVDVCWLSIYFPHLTQGCKTFRRSRPRTVTVTSKLSGPSQII